MKHLPSGSELWLSEQMNQAQISADSISIEKLLHHLSLVIEENTRLNLTRITSPEEALRLHILDSLLVLPELKLAPQGTFADLGTGAGYPGIPLSIISGRRAVLVESVKKKAAAVSRFVDELGMQEDIAVLPVRAEELAAELPSHFSAVVARALSSLPSLVELAAPLLVSGGTLICLKGSPTSEEISASNKVAKMVGMTSAVVRRYNLPRGGENRSAITFTKVSDSAVQLPRRPGMAQRYPLA